MTSSSKLGNLQDMFLEYSRMLTGMNFRNVGMLTQDGVRGTIDEWTSHYFFAGVAIPRLTLRGAVSKLFLARDEGVLEPTLLCPELAGVVDTLVSTHMTPKGYQSVRVTSMPAAGARQFWLEVLFRSTRKHKIILSVPLLGTAMNKSYHINRVQRTMRLLRSEIVERNFGISIGDASLLDRLTLRLIVGEILERPNESAMELQFDDIPLFIKVYRTHQVVFKIYVRAVYSTKMSNALTESMLMSF